MPFFSIPIYSILFNSILLYSILFSCPILFHSILFSPILCILFYFIIRFCSVLLFYSILFYSILFYSILFYSILFYSILFYPILFRSTPSHPITFYSPFPFFSISFHLKDHLLCIWYPGLMPTNTISSSTSCIMLFTQSIDRVATANCKSQVSRSDSNTSQLFCTIYFCTNSVSVLRFSYERK